jgi:hypothetical protein
MDALAGATAAMLGAIHDAGFADQVAFVELHNEVDFSHVPADAARIDSAVRRVSAAFPAVPVTVSYGKPPHLDMAEVPESLQVGQFHIYAYGVLDALQQQIDLRSTGTADFPNAARSLVEDQLGGVALYTPSAQGAAEIIGDSCNRRWHRDTFDGETFAVDADSGEPFAFGIGRVHRLLAIGRFIDDAQYPGRGIAPGRDRRIGKIQHHFAQHGIVFNQQDSHRRSR